MIYTNKGLVEHCEELIRVGAGYVYGAYFDKPISEAYLQTKAKQYPERYNKIMNDGKTYLQHSRRWIGKLAGDCVGLHKSYYWLNDDGQVIYRKDNRADVSADGIYNMSSEKGIIKTMPELPGLGVYQPGHVGVYIGNGQVIESRGVDYGMVITDVNNRGWVAWFKVPYITYIGGADILQKRDKGLEVGLWQKNLKRWNNQALPVYGVDESFGAETEYWTKEFQKSVGLPVTGQVGAVDWGAMVTYFVSILQQISSIMKDKGV